LVNLELGPQCEVATLLIDSGTSRSSLCVLPRGLIYSPERILISGVKEESLQLKTYKKQMFFSRTGLKRKIALKQGCKTW
jgi:hypothetical protein